MARILYASYPLIATLALVPKFVAVVAVAAADVVDSTTADVVGGTAVPSGVANSPADIDHGLA